MNYLATIKGHYDSESRMFKTLAAAEQWLDEHNNNYETITYIDEYDENWIKVGSFTYTQGART